MAPSTFKLLSSAVQAEPGAEAAASVPPTQSTHTWDPQQTKTYEAGGTIGHTQSKDTSTGQGATAFPAILGATCTRYTSVGNTGHGLFLPGARGGSANFARRLVSLLHKAVVNHLNTLQRS